jgi:GR25 family glycosyltransferase involved in LPS biosynthesis
MNNIINYDNFDFNFYSNMYIDLNQNLINSNKQLYDHWINVGFYEKRIIRITNIDIYDIEKYIIDYHDLKDFTIINAFNHWIYYGINENRILRKKKYITMIEFGKYGRLGNQLFQYALLYKLSKIYNCSIKIPIYNEEYVCNENTIDKKKTKIHKYFNLNHSELNINKFNKDDYYNIKERNFSFDSDIIEVKNIENNINILGYFQSYKYFDDIKNDIINIYNFHENTLNYCNNIINNIKNNRDINIVGIHLRRGDLDNYSGYGPPINIEYIYNSINYIKQYIKYPVFLIMSDDVEWVKNNLIINDELHYSNNNEIEDLCLITLCNHLILSNSSFSWWGGYLNKNENKIIIIKSIENQDYFFDYIVPYENRKDLIPESWIQIKDNLKTNTLNVIYSTLFQKLDNITFKKINLIKNIEILNIDNMYSTYDMGIILPVYETTSLEKLYILIKNSIYSFFKIIILIFDNTFENLDQKNIINNFDFDNVTILKIYTKSDKLNNFNFNSTSQLHLKYCSDILFRLNCYYVINLDNIDNLNYNWLLNIYYNINKIKNIYYIGYINYKSESSNIYDTYNLLYNKNIFYNELYGIFDDKILINNINEKLYSFIIEVTSINNNKNSILNDIVDKVFFINLENRNDRLNKLFKNLYKNNIFNIERINGIIPEINYNEYNEINFSNYINNRYTDKKFFYDTNNNYYNNLHFDWFINNNPDINHLKGIIGCKMSHVKIIEIAKKRNYKNILIIEDDINFIEKWEYHLINSIKSIEKYDLLYFTNTHIIPYTQINNYLVKPNNGLQASGYIVNNSLFDYILDNALISGMEIDNFYVKYIQHNNNYKCYSICPNIINQISEYSNIENKYVNYSENFIMHTINKYDIVFVCHSKDKDNLLKCYESIKKYLCHYNNFYLIAKENYLSKYNEVIFIDENLFPFNKDDIKYIISNKCPVYKYGWYYQQLLKLYIFKIVLHLTDNYIIIDSDVVFLDYITFFDENNKPYFTLGNEFNLAYFEHINLLIPSLKKQHHKSGISHHMIFNKKILEILFNNIENYHNDVLWKVFLKKVEFDDSNNYSRASEYELYFNYVLKYYKEYYSIREINWINSSTLNINDPTIKYIALHDYLVNDHKNYIIE